jgi:regulator of sigma E protease
MITLLIFIAILGLLVFFHELGHFLVAKWHGIKSDEFGFGFPPRICGIVKDDVSGRYRLLWGNKDIQSTHTLYSLNWIPLGGFVRIEGEDGSRADDPKSFASRPAWTRIKVLGAGVFMNFVTAWVLFSIVFWLGLPQAIDDSERDAYADVKIQIVEVKTGSPAESMGLQAGDSIVAIDGEPVTALSQVSALIAAHKGESISVDINRFGKPLQFAGVPRIEYPSDEGALGISFSETAVVAYPWYESIWRGAQTTYSATIAIFGAFGKMLGSLVGVGTKTAVDVTGPVGIVYLTKQMSDLGLSYLLQFAALLAVNLGIINILPIPALDGGRILFVLIEKLKGSPVSRHVEGMIHQVGFLLLLLLMFFVTLRDVSQFRIVEKLARFF